MSGRVIETPIASHIFHNEATAVGNGKKFIVGSFKTMTLSGKGTSSARTAEFRGIDINGTDELIYGFDNAFLKATGFTTNGKVWQVPIEGYKYFYVKITALPDGDETIAGEATL